MEAIAEAVRADGGRWKQVRVKPGTDGNAESRRNVGATEIGRRSTELWMSGSVGQEERQHRRDLSQTLHAGSPTDRNDAFSSP